MIKVLSIGNSFSQDAQRYLHNVAANEGVEMKCMNLYIGGCSLRTHYINMLENKKAYEMEFNGQSTAIRVSISEALASDDWDFVTLQQASHFSFDYDTYVPYIEKLADYVRLYVPKSKILIHQTWAYEQGSERLASVGFCESKEMFNKIEDAYCKAAKLIQADGIIPCGKNMMQAIDAGILKIHRDTFHAELGIGRYLLAATWYKALTGRNIQNEFNEFDTETPAAEIKIVNNIINKEER